MGLVACPFCREMFEEGEEPSCPVCGMALKPIEKLGLSHDAATEDGVPSEPEKEPLPRFYLGRMRGPLALSGLAGVALFFLPWIKVTVPDLYELSGFDIAKRRVWVWMALAAWMVLVPTVLSRRSIWQMRTARVAAAFLAAIPAITTFILWIKPPQSRLIPVQLGYDWPLFATFALSVVTIAVAFRFGGRVDDITVTRGTSAGQSLQ